MRGRPPKPTVLSPEPPDWLSADQKEVWRYALAHAPRGALKASDQAALTVWVVAFEQHRTAVMMQAKSAKDPFNGAIVSPYVGIANRASLRMQQAAGSRQQAAGSRQQAAGQLGFTPASRPRLVQGDQLPGGESEWAQLMVVDVGG